LLDLLNKHSNAFIICRCLITVSVQLKYIDEKDRDRWHHRVIANKKQKSKSKERADDKAKDERAREREIESIPHRAS